MSNLKPIEKKVLGAMLILSDENMNLKTSLRNIATTMGYKEAGGALSFAIQALEMKNMIDVTGKGSYTITL